MRVRAEGISFGFDPRTGRLDGFDVEDGGRTIAPLHRAPWSPDEVPEGEAPLMARLGGDFFCAPFALSEGDSPLHGWPPNWPWEVQAGEGGTIRAALTRQVMGARVVKELSVTDGHPFVYQRHMLIGGSGRLPVANHANVSVPNGAFIRTSPKSAWETPKEPQESDPARGRSALRYPARTRDLRAFPGPDNPTDLTRYPWNPRHEDFVVGIEAGPGLGWTAVTRPEEGDLFLSLHDSSRLPMTMLWHSNGGRDYAPWSGRHFGCLGVEIGAADHMLGLSSEADLPGPGALTLTPGGTAETRHVIGAIDWPSGAPVESVTLEEGGIRVTGEDGAGRTVPLRPGFVPDA